MKKLLNKKGFTLIELIVVIAILAILAMILIPSLTGYIAKATNAKNAANCRSEYTRYQLDLAVGNTVSTVAQIIDRIKADTTGGVTITPTTTTKETEVLGFICKFGNISYSLVDGFKTP